MLHTLYTYCKNNIDCFEALEEIALDNINKMRCPLSMAESTLYDRMQEAVSEYCEDNDLDPEDFDIEEIFWAGEN